MSNHGSRLKAAERRRSRRGGLVDGVSPAEFFGGADKIPSWFLHDGSERPSKPRRGEVSLDEYLRLTASEMDRRTAPEGE